MLYKVVNIIGYGIMSILAIIILLLLFCSYLEIAQSKSREPAVNACFTYKDVEVWEQPDISGIVVVGNKKLLTVDLIYGGGCCTREIDKLIFEDTFKVVDCSKQLQKCINSYKNRGIGCWSIL